MSASYSETAGPRRVNRRRLAIWAAAAGLILLVPTVAMQFTDAVKWTPFDFIVAGTLLFGSALVFELIARWGNTTIYRAAVGLAVVTGLLLVWINGAVGIIGSEDNDFNSLYFGVLLIGVIGAFVSRLKPHGMAWALGAMAGAQMAVPVIAVATSQPLDAGLVPTFLLNAVFAVMWIGSAWLFHEASIQRDSTMHRAIAIVLLTAGVLLMILQMYADSEPGLIPIVLVAMGGGYFFVDQRKRRKRPTGPNEQ